MKTAQFQKTSKLLLPYTLLIGLVLIFISGVPLTGRDLALSTDLGDGGPRAWLRMAENSGGNYLSALFTAILIDIPVLRHLLLAAALGSTFIAMTSFCGLEKPYMYFVLALLAIGTPATLFAYCFGNTSGNGTVLIPAFLLVMYLFSLSDLLYYKGRKKAWKIPFLFLSGFMGQLFSESIAVGILVVSLFFWIVLCKKYGFNWHLAAHSFGCVLGLVFSLVVSGTVDLISESFYVIVDRLSSALDQLFVSNILIQSVMTISCLMLIQPIRTERSKNCNLTLAFLLIPMAVLFMLHVLRPAMEAYRSLVMILTAVKLVAAIIYTYGLYRTLQHYVSKHTVLIRVQVCVVSVWVFVIVFALTGNALPHLLYIPYLLMVAATVALLVYAIHRYDRLGKVIRKPLFFVGLLGILALSLVTISNHGYCNVVDTHIGDCLSDDITQITLPCAPYEDRLVPTDLTQLSDYYDFPSYGNVEITYIPFGQWDWETFYEAHNIPVIEEYDENAPENQDWAGEIQED